jgi:hypothetical protein
MKTPAPAPHLPPRLSMEDYARVVQSFLRDRDPGKVERQKALEKRIRKPFRMSDINQNKENT